MSNLREAAQQALQWIRRGNPDIAHEVLFEAIAQPDDKAQPVASSALGEVIGCFEAAFCEGLQEALSETKDERLKDLVERRLMHALYAAQNAAPQPPAEQSEPEWIDDPHDIEQWMMRNPKWKPAEQGAELSDERIVAAARVLAKRHAESCGTDAHDVWNFYAEDFKADARAALEAADRAARGGAV